ncbi:MAG: nucleotidyltransferase domain-containing protein [Candidatus Brocadiales bacterium]
MIQEDLLVKVIDRLNQVNIPYMITGGIATIFYGRPRLTHDFDIVIDVGPEQIQRLIDTFGKEFYISEEAIREAMDKHSMFNLIHLDSGIKVDFWMLQDDPFDRRRFGRRQRHAYSGREIVFSSPEDVVLKKLLWFKETEVERHLADALGVLEIQQGLDVAYLKEWAERLTIQDLLNELLKKVEKQD